MTETTDLSTGTDQPGETPAQDSRAAAGAEQSQKGQGGLSALKLAQLQSLASQLGITGARRMRKSALVDAISAHQRGSAVADREKKAEQAAADHRAAFAATGAGFNRVKIFNGAINEAILSFRAFNRRDPGV